MRPHGDSWAIKTHVKQVNLFIGSGNLLIGLFGERFLRTPEKR